MAGLKEEMKERTILLRDFGIEITPEIRSHLSELTGDIPAQERYCHMLISDHLDTEEDRSLRRVSC